MNIRYFFLSLLLLLVPGCKKKARYAAAPVIPCEQTVPERAEYDEELGAYVVKEDENKFSAAAAAQAQQEEELSAMTELAPGDLVNDSARYGFKTLYFEYDKYRLNDLREDQRAVLNHDLKVAKSLTDKGYRLVLEGHADNAGGSTEYNMALSERRAEMVKNYFNDHDVDGNIKTKGCGAEFRVVPSGTKEQQAPNRRVEIYAYPDESAAPAA